MDGVETVAKGQQTRVALSAVASARPVVARSFAPLVSANIPGLFAKPFRSNADAAQIIPAARLSCNRRTP